MMTRKALAGMLLCIGLAVDAAAAEPDNIFGIELPQSLDDLDAIAHEDPEAQFKFKKWYSSYFFQGKQEYEDPRLGYSLGYATTSGTDISVYVYDLGMEDISDGPASPPVADELVRSSREIIASDRYAGAEQRFIARPLSPHFVQAFHALTSENGEQIKSYTLVRGQNGFFVKIRVTGAALALEARVADLLKYLSADLGIGNSDAEAG